MVIASNTTALSRMYSSTTRRVLTGRSLSLVATFFHLVICILNREALVYIFEGTYSTTVVHVPYAMMLTPIS